MKSSKIVLLLLVIFSSIQGSPQKDAIVKIKNCVICLEEIEKQHIVVQLPCYKSHHYHFDCITKDVLLGKRSKCPLCCKKFCEDDQKRIAELHQGVSYASPGKSLSERLVELHEYSLTPEFGKKFTRTCILLILFFNTCMCLAP